MTTPPPGWDEVYTADTPPPWDIGRPQPAFVRLADDGLLRGQVLDAGCGRGEQALLAADRVAGASSYLGKHAGFGAMLGFMLGQVLGALGQVFRSPGYGLKLAYSILTGVRVDGTQGGVLG